MHLFIDKFSPATFYWCAYVKSGEWAIMYCERYRFCLFLRFFCSVLTVYFLFFTLLHDLCEPSYEELFLIKMHIVSIILMADYFIFYFKWNV